MSTYHEKWVKGFVTIPSDDHYNLFKAQFSRYTHEGSLNKVTELTLGTAERFPQQVPILRNVIADHFPQYQTLIDKILMLQ